VNKRAARLLLWAGAVAILAAGAWALYLARTRPPALPPLAAYPLLPAGFSVRLREARASATHDENRPEAFRALAKLYLANRLDEPARACLELLRGTPGGLTAKDHYFLALIAEDEDDLKRAVVELRATVAGDPGYLPGGLALGLALFKEGLSDDARQAYRGVISAFPDQPQAMFALARLDLQKGDDAAAIARLEEVLSVHHEMTSAAALLSQVFERQGEEAKAAAMRKWSRQNPEPEPLDPWQDSLLVDCFDVQRLGLRFEDYFASGQLDQALPLLGQIEKLDPNSPIPHLLRGWTAARDHDDAGAVAEYRLALDRGGDPEKICPYVVQSLYTLGRPAEATALLAEFHAKKPESLSLLVAYADAAVRSGDAALSRRLLVEVLQKEPDLYAANMNLARILWTAGEKDQAAVLLKKAAQGAPDDVPSRALLGQYFLARADPVSAIKPLEEALALEKAQTPSADSLRSMLYTAYVQAGSTDGDMTAAGRSDLEKAARLEPSNPAAFALEASGYARAGRFEEAEAALDRIVVLQPTNPTVYLSRGDVRYHAGEKDKAHADWDKALALTSPGEGPLRDALSARLDHAITEDTFK
jgi:tetratricopeptide (TPR) repeat protein